MKDEKLIYDAGNMKDLWCREHEGKYLFQIKSDKII